MISKGTQTEKNVVSVGTLTERGINKGVQKDYYDGYVAPASSSSYQNEVLADFFQKTLSKIKSPTQDNQKSSQTEITEVEESESSQNDNDIRERERERERESEPKERKN